MTDAEILRYIASAVMLRIPEWEVKREDLLRIAQRLEDLDREADPRDGILGAK